MLQVESQKEDIPEWMSKAIDDVNAAFNLTDADFEAAFGKIDFKRALTRGLDIRFITRRRALKALLLIRLWLVRGVMLKHSIPGKQRDGLSSLSNKRALETCQTLLNSQFCFEAHIRCKQQQMPNFVLHLELIVVVGSVVELEKYFEPSFKIIEDNHNFSAADVG